MRESRQRNRNHKERQREYDKSPRTRAAILAAATEEFSTHGFGGARVDRIAQAAKLNNHALYYHFGNKDDLFQAVLEHGYESLRANQEPRELGAMPPEAGMAKIISDVFDFVQAMPQHMAIAFDVNRNRGANLTTGLRRRVRAAASPLTRDIALVLRRGKAARRFAADIDPEHLYFSIFALCSFYFTNAYTVSAVVGWDLLEPRAIAERKRQIVRFVLAAIKR